MSALRLHYFRSILSNFYSGFVHGLILAVFLLGMTGSVQAQQTEEPIWFNADHSKYITVPQFEEDVEMYRRVFLEKAEKRGAVVVQDDTFDEWLHEQYYSLCKSLGVSILGTPKFMRNRD